MTRPTSTRSAAETLRRPLLALATVATGLVAGMFFAFTFSVMPGMQRLDDRAFVTAMHHNIEATVDSAAFMTTFTVAPLLLAAAAFVHHRLEMRTATRWLLAALVLYLVAFGITMGLSVPLNDALVEAGTPSDADLASVRSDFEDPWNSAHNIRTALGTLALACCSLAVASRRQTDATD